MRERSLIHSLGVYSDDQLVFSSDGKWIYPLFELEGFLSESPHAPEELRVIDKVIGKAAAMVLVHLGFGRIHGGMLSRLAKDFLQQRRVAFTYDELVDRILCRTEELLADIDDPAEAFHLLKLRAARTGEESGWELPNQGGQR